MKKVLWFSADATLEQVNTLCKAMNNAISADGKAEVVEFSKDTYIIIGNKEAEEVYNILMKEALQHKQIVA